MQFIVVEVFVACVLNLITLICYYACSLVSTRNVYFASNTKHSLTYNMAACTWWPCIHSLVTSLHLFYTCNVHYEKTYHTSRCNVQRCDLAADSITCCMSCKCITDTDLFDIGGALQIQDWSLQSRNWRPVKVCNAKFSRDRSAMTRPVSDCSLLCLSCPFEGVCLLFLRFVICRLHSR